MAYEIYSTDGGSEQDAHFRLLRTELDEEVASINAAANAHTAEVENFRKATERISYLWDISDDDPNEVVAIGVHDEEGRIVKVDLTDPAILKAICKAVYYYGSQGIHDDHFEP